MPRRSPATPASLDVTIQNQQRRFPVPATRVARLVERVRARLGHPARAVAIRFVNDPRIRRLNHQFTGRRRATDVLAFPGDGIPGYWGDLVISCETATRNARRYGCRPHQELLLYVLHGLLHLSGYDHTRDRGEMRTLEWELARTLIRFPRRAYAGMGSRPEAS